LAGSFSGTFQSPDGKYTLTVSDAGIRAEGPSGHWCMDNSGLTLDSAAVLTAKSAAKLDLSAGGVASLRGSMTHLGCGGEAGCPPRRSRHRAWDSPGQLNDGDDPARRALRSHLLAAS
jgi:hypothetical protein